MQKPVVINAYAGDSISLRISVYDEDGRPFDNTAFEIDTVNLVIVGLEGSPISGSIANHVVSAFIPAGTFTEAGDNAFYVQLINETNEVCFTVIEGSIHVTELPE